MERLVVKKNSLPVEWCKNNADIMALAGIWKNKPRTIEEIREKAFFRPGNVLPTNVLKDPELLMW
jgi:hypothetical protein